MTGHHTSVSRAIQATSSAQPSPAQCLYPWRQTLRVRDSYLLFPLASTSAWKVVFLPSPNSGQTWRRHSPGMLSQLPDKLTWTQKAARWRSVP